MKTIASTVIIALFGWLLVSGQANAETVKPPTPDALADSDGDGALDATDLTPFVAEVAWISWDIGAMKVGWKLTATKEETKTLLTEQENEILSQNTCEFGRKIEVSTEVISQAKARLSSNPLEIGTSAEAKFQTQFAASSEVVWSDTDRNLARDLTRIVSQNQVAQKLSDMHLEFMVNFYNFSDEDFVGENLQIPIKDGESVSTIAQYFGANGPETRFRIPANRYIAIPYRFRASLDTTQSLTLLKAMEQSSPAVSLEESPGSITNMIDGKKDAISALTKMHRNCCKLIAELDGREFTWFVARRNAKTMEPLHLSDAFNAINAMPAYSGDGKAQLFAHTDKYLRSAVGRDCLLHPVRWRVVAPAASVVNAKIPAIEKEILRLRREAERLGDTERQEFKKLESLDKNAKDAQTQFTEAEKAHSDANDAVNKGFMERERKTYKADNEREASADLDKKRDILTKAKLAADTARKVLVESPLSQLQSKIVAKEKELQPLLVEQIAAAAKDQDVDPSIELPDEIRLRERAGFPNDMRRWEQLGGRADAWTLSVAGELLSRGIGEIVKDEKRAVELFQKAADLGNAEALAVLGKAQIKGELGMPKDEMKAVGLLQKASDAGDADATSILADGYAKGLYGLPLDEKKAAELKIKLH